MSHYRAEYVESKLNLADGPSRNDMSLVEDIGATEIPLRFPELQGGLFGWASKAHEAKRLVV